MLNNLLDDHLHSVGHLHPVYPNHLFQKTFFDNFRKTIKFNITDFWKKNQDFLITELIIVYVMRRTLLFFLKKELLPVVKIHNGRKNHYDGTLPKNFVFF
jgi:hypothetical protein